MTFLADVRADLDFTEADEARLRSLASMLEPGLRGIAEMLRRRAAVQHPNLSVEETIEWMRSGLRGPWDASFYADRAARGRRLVERGLPSALIVTIVYHVRTSYLKQLDGNVTVEDRLTVHKLIDLELAILLHCFQQESENQLVLRERQWQAGQRAAMQTLSIGFAHELRNPLNSARLQFDVLERRIRRFIADQPLVAEPAALARQEIERLCELVEDFLAYAQPPPLAPVMCDIVGLAEHVVETEQEFARDHGVALAIERPASRWHARVDGDKVRQAIKNLVRNGLEAAPPGGHVDVQVTGVDGHVHVVIADNGPGIPEKVRARMFEPFFSTKDTGTGLGMSIVQSVVAMHGGALDVSSSSEGTRIDMSLPRAV